MHLCAAITLVVSFFAVGMALGVGIAGMMHKVPPFSPCPAPPPPPPCPRPVPANAQWLFWSAVVYVLCSFVVYTCGYDAGVAANRRRVEFTAGEVNLAVQCGATLEEARLVLPKLKPDKRETITRSDFMFILAQTELDATLERRRDLCVSPS